MSTKEQKIRRRVRRVNTTVLVLVVIIVVSSVALTFISILVSTHNAKVAQEENDKRWCGLLVTLDDAYNSGKQKPTTELGRMIAAQLHELRVDYHC